MFLSWSTHTFTIHQTKKAVIVMAGFNTPGSKVDRNFLAEAELNHAKQTAEATLVSPWVKLAAKGRTFSRFTKLYFIVSLFFCKFNYS